MDHRLSIRFLGGVGTVTGSKFLIQNSQQKILVECGLFQGLKELRLQNRAPLPVALSEIDAVILTHAHLDHIGYLPVLSKNGWKGPVYCTEPTRDLAEILLLDSAKIQESDANYANLKGYSKHHPALPLYTTENALAALDCFRPVPAHQWNALEHGTRFRLIPSGHILGSSFIELEMSQKKIVFSGDLGREKPLLFHPPSSISDADYLLVESTYGDRMHDVLPPEQALAQVIMDTIQQGGHLLIASFAVGRAQDLLFLISQLKQKNMIPDIPVFLDSPMARDATDIFCKHSDWHARSEEEVKKICRVARMVRTVEESKALLEMSQSTIVIAASGMLTGGRILFHLENRMQDEKNTILLVGYQAAGTRGALLRQGLPQLKMHGRYVPVRAQIRELTSLSAHADQGEIIHWLKGFKAAPKTTFLVHGEPQAADALRVRIQDELQWPCRIPRPMEEISLEGLA